MYYRHTFRIAAVFLCLALASAQNNYVDDYDYDAPAPPPQRSGPSRTFSRPSAPAHSGPRPTPVAILKQIDKHNEDGSYTYGYEGGDGSFKIETKLVTGEVMGKYGYVDDTGKVRVVEYGANRYGFMPAGEGITVAPPTIVDETTKRGPNGEIIEEYYPEDNLPPPQQRRPAPRVKPAPRPQPQYEPEPQFDDFRPAPAPQQRRPSQSSSGPAPPRLAVPGAAPVFNPAPVYEERPAPQPQRTFSEPAPQQHRSFSQPAPQQHRSFSQPAPQQQRTFSQPAPQQHRSFSAPAPSSRFESLPPLPPPPQRPHHLPPPQPSRAQHARTSGGILDQLERDYALPQSASIATHDISFGSY